MTNKTKPSLLVQTIHSIRSQLTVFRFDDSLNKEAIITQLSGFLKRVELLELAQNQLRSQKQEIVHLSRIVSTVKENYNLEQQSRLYIHSKPLTVFANREMLEVLLYELIDNALRYSKEEVHISMHQADKKVVVRIEDFGPGIPLAVRERIAEPYVKLGKNTSSSDGLGLAIAWAITRAYEGSMTLVCEAKQGTTAIVSFANAKYRS